MLEIIPSLDPAILKPYCEKCGKTYGPEFFAYLASRGGTLLAAGLFEMLGDRVQAVMYEGDKNDPWLFDGVLRAGLHYAITKRSILIGCLPKEFRAEYAELFKPLNYPAGNTFDIPSFFKLYKNCGRGPEND